LVTTTKSAINVADEIYFFIEDKKPSTISH